MPDVPDGDPTLVGWREWVSLPAWDVAWVKAKVDTGARTSSLHAWDLATFDRGGAPWVRFAIHPWQDSDRDEVQVEAPLVDHREVRSSSGAAEPRPVVRTELSLAGRLVAAEVTLARRDEMGFRMLVGREALRGRFLVDPERSYLGGKPPRALRRPR